MYGVYHEPAGTGAPRAALLMCPPLGQEAVRTHRIYKVLAEQLAQRGLGVLRFDYHATGESPGDDEEGDLQGWTSDVLAAHQELLARSGAVRTVWFGSRMGAWLAASASAGTDPVPAIPAALVLWAPIARGEDYLEMLAQHSRADSIPPGRRLPGQAVGFGVSEQLERQFASLDATVYARSTVKRLALAGDAASAELEALADALRSRGENLRVVRDLTALDWISDEALNTALVPAVVIATLKSMILEECE